MGPLQLVLHTPQKKAKNISCATQHHHLETGILTRGKVKQKERADIRDILIVPLCNNNLNVMTPTEYSWLCK